MIQRLIVDTGISATHPLDFDSEIRYLQEKAHSAHLDDQREAVAGFLHMAQQNSEHTREYGLIGMLSVLNLSENVGILSSVASNLILLLDPSALDGYHSDLFRFAFSILTALSSKFDQLPEIHQARIHQQLTQLEAVVSNPTLQEAIREFIREPTGFRSRMVMADTLIPIEIPVIALEPSLAAVVLETSGTRVVEKQEVVVEKEPVADPDLIEAMAAIFYNTKILLAESYGNYALSEPYFIYIVAYLDAVIRKISSHLHLQKQKKLAFVVHFSAVLPHGISDKYPIFVVKEDVGQGIRQYHDLFASIVTHGYKQVVVLMPHGDYWISYHHAKHAAHQFDHVVHVVDTQLFGLGLGLLLQALCPLAMQLHSVKVLLGLVTRLANSIQYWMVPLMPGSMKNQLWYQKMNRQSDLYDSVWESQIPLILLSHKSAILSRSETPTRALLNLQQAVLAAVVSPLKLMVEHHGLRLEAGAIGRYFQQQFPHAEITIVATSLYLGNEWGPFIGVVVLYP